MAINKDEEVHPSSLSISSCQQFKTSKPNGFPEPQEWLETTCVFGSNKHPKMRLGVVECTWYAGRAISCTHLPGTVKCHVRIQSQVRSAFTKLSDKHGQGVDEVKHRSITLYLYYIDIYDYICIYTYNIVSYSVYLGCWSLLKILQQNILKENWNCAQIRNCLLGCRSLPV